MVLTPELIFRRCYVKNYSWKWNYDHYNKIGRAYYQLNIPSIGEFFPFRARNISHLLPFFSKITEHFPSIQTKTSNQNTSLAIPSFLYRNGPPESITEEKKTHSSYKKWAENRNLNNLSWTEFSETTNITRIVEDSTTTNVINDR